MSDPVADGREALNPWFGYPWYDAETDGIRRVEAPKPQSYTSEPLVDLSTPLLQWTAWIAIGLALAALVYLLTRAFLNRERVAKETEDEPVGTLDHVESLPVPVAQSRADLLAEARRLYEQGDYGQAIAYYFGYQLLQLDKRHVIRLARGKTNRQYLREVGPRATLRQLLEDTMVTFEEVYFGRHTIDRGRFESCWSRLDEFQSLLEGTP